MLIDRSCSETTVGAGDAAESGVELWRSSRINCYNGRKTGRSYEVYYHGSSQFAGQTAAYAEINLCAGKRRVRKSTLMTRCIESKCISKLNVARARAQRVLYAYRMQEESNDYIQR